MQASTRQERWRQRAHEQGLCETCHEALSDDEQALGARSCRECRRKASLRARKAKQRAKLRAKHPRP